MDSIDLEVLKTAAGWIADGLRCELVTVIKTWGSSPRPIGATLAICGDGRVVGSVSGGCVEADVAERAKAVLAGGMPEVHSYGIADEEAWRVGLPCGGEIDGFVEPFADTPPP
mgnify:CR=1 FL=1